MFKNSKKNERQEKDKIMFSFKKKPKPELTVSLPKDVDFTAFTHEQLKRIADISSEIKYAKEFLDTLGSKKEDLTEVSFNIRGDKWRFTAYSKQDASVHAFAAIWARDVARRFIAFKEDDLKELCERED